VHEEWEIPLFKMYGGVMEGKVRNLIEKIITSNGYILDEVLYIEEDGIKFLRIIIDKEGFINVNDCVTVNNLIDPIIDKLDIEESFILDVCSKTKGSI